MGCPAGERGACGVARPSLKGDLLFAPPAYHWLLVSNAALRLAWLHKLVPRLRRSHGAVLGFALLEVYRSAPPAHLLCCCACRVLRPAAAFFSPLPATHTDTTSPSMLPAALKT